MGVECLEGRVRRWGGSDRDRQVRCWKRLPERRTEDPHDLLPQVPGENIAEGQVGARCQASLGVFSLGSSRRRKLEPALQSCVVGDTERRGLPAVPTALRVGS